MKSFREQKVAAKQKMGKAIYSVIDLETTGLDYKKQGITEIGIIQLNSKFEEIGSFHTYVATSFPVSENITNLTGITKQHLDDYGMTVAAAGEIVRTMLEGTIVVAQHAPFDLSFLHEILYVQADDYYCTRSMTNIAEPNEEAKLVKTCERLNIKLDDAHTAMGDVRATAELFKYRMESGDLGSNINTLTVAPDRAVSYIPRSTRTVLLKGEEPTVLFRLEGWSGE